MIPAARLIVCERTGRWATVLRRELGQQGPRVHETRHLDDVWSELPAARASLVVVEASPARLAAVANWLLRLGTTYPLARTIIVGDANLAEIEWLLREAGAIWVHRLIRDPAPVVRVALRHLAACRSADRSWREQCFDRLPWSEPADPA